MLIKINLPKFASAVDKRAQALKVLEEAAELCEAAKFCAKCSEGSAECGACEISADCCARTDMMDEYADVLQTLVNLAAAHCIDAREIAAAQERCFERNMERGRYLIERVKRQRELDALLMGDAE